MHHPTHLRKPAARTLPAPTTVGLPPRPFEAEAAEAGASAAPDPRIRREHAERLGHHFGSVRVTASESAPPGGRVLPAGAARSAPPPATSGTASEGGAIQMKRRGRRKRTGPKYRDPVVNNLKKLGTGPAPTLESVTAGLRRPEKLAEIRREVRGRMGVPEENLDDPVVAVPRGVIGDEPAHVDEMLQRLPSRYARDPEIRRLLLERDTARTQVQRALGARAEVQETEDVEPNRVREVLAATEWARQSGMSSRDIRSAKGYDFDVGGRAVDPFETPPNALSGNALEARRWLGVTGARRPAYPLHTGGTKGGGHDVTGIWDQTYSSPEEIRQIEEIRRREGVPRGNRDDVRVPLEEGYIEDEIAQQARTRLPLAISYHEAAQQWRKSRTQTSLKDASRRRRKYQERQRKKQQG